MPQAVYKDTPNNRKLNRVGKPLGDPKHKVSKSKPKFVADKSKPMGDKDLFLEALNVMATVGKSQDPKKVAKKNPAQKDTTEMRKLKARLSKNNNKLTPTLLLDIMRNNTDAVRQIDDYISRKTFKDSIKKKDFKTPREAVQYNVERFYQKFFKGKTFTFSKIEDMIEEDLFEFDFVNRKGKVIAGGNEDQTK
jgi:hypothetical protein